MQLHVNVYLFLAHIWPRRTKFTGMSPKIIVFLTQINPQSDKKVGQTHSNYFLGDSLLWLQLVVC